MMRQPITHKPRGFFITATDTGCGKTIIGSLLTKKLYCDGQNVQPRKPIESGCQIENGVLTPTDGLSYFNATQHSIPLDTITPYKLPHLVSPARAAEIEGVFISADDLLRACTQSSSADDILIVEGAGGFYSPIAHKTDNATLATMLKLPILLIASNQLGCINHIMLTLQAIERHNLVVSAIVLNQTRPPTPNNLEHNLECLHTLTQTPIIEFPFINNTLDDSVHSSLQYLTDLI